MSTPVFNSIFERTLPNATGDYVEIGTWSLSTGSATFHVSVVVSDASFSVSKQYLLALSDSVGSSGTFVKALPFANTGADGSEDFDLVVRRTTNDLTMRLRRTGGTATSVGAQINVRREGVISDTFAASQSTGTMSAPSTLFETAVMTQVGGDVGIGEASPETRLHVTDSSAPILSKRNNSNTIGPASAANFRATTDDDMVDGYGSVINFQIEDTAAVVNTVGNVGFVRNGADNSGAFVVRPASGGSISEAMRVDSSGKVGIGTTSPAASLHVIGTILAGTNATDNADKVGFFACQHYDIDEEPFLGIAVNPRNNDNDIEIGGGSAVFNTATLIKFYTAANITTLNGTEALRIDSDQNVAIQGSALNSNTELTVNGGGNIAMVGSAPVLTVNSSNAISGFRINVTGLDQDTDLLFRLQDSGTERLRVMRDGQVGIGETDPDNMLHVTDSGVPALFERTTNATNSAAGVLNLLHNTSSNMVDDFAVALNFQIEDSANVVNSIGQFFALRDGADNSGALTFRTASSGSFSEAMRIDSSQRVGIGETSPDTKLHVTDSSQPVIIERTTAATSGVLGQISLDHNTSGNMADGFGSALTFRIQDATAGPFGAASIYGIRDGADNSGALTFLTFNAASATEAMRIDSSQNVGIGETSPVHKVQILNTNNTRSLDVAGDGTWAFAHGRFRKTDGSESGIVISNSAQEFTIGVDPAADQTFSANSFFIYDNTAALLRLVLETDGGLELMNSSSAGVSASGRAKIRVSSSGNLQLSNNGGAYADIATGSGLSGSGTTGTIAKFTASDTVGDSIITESSSKIGINESTPGAKLHITGPIDPSSDDAQLRLMGGSAPAGNFWDIFDNHSATSDFGLTFTKDGSTTYLTLGHSTQDTYFGPITGSTAVVGVGRVATTNNFEVEGDASKTSSGSWSANSDRRIKEDIRDIRGALETIKRLRPVTFRYKEGYRAEHQTIGDHRYYNYIAQEYAQVFPKSVKQDPVDGLLQLDPHNASVVSVAAIQELSGKMDALDRRLADVEARIN